MATTHEKLDQIIEALKPKAISAQPPANSEKPDDGKDTLKRLGFMAVLDVVLFIATALIYSFDSAVFGISLGFFIASMIITFVLMIDWKVIPGDTIKKISDNSVALAILLFIIACSIWVGILIGEGYRPQALQGEAKHNVESVSDPEPSGLDNR